MLNADFNMDGSNFNYGFDTYHGTDLEPLYNNYVDLATKANIKFT